MHKIHNGNTKPLPVAGYFALFSIEEFRFTVALANYAKTSQESLCPPGRGGRPSPDHRQDRLR